MSTPLSPRMRVVIDNDYSGDPDGLLQLLHHALSPSVDIRAVIGSAVRADDPFDPSGRSADNAPASQRRPAATCRSTTSGSTARPRRWCSATRRSRSGRCRATPTGRRS